MIIRFVKMLLRCVFCWREKYATKEQIKNAQAIVAFSFGARRCGPGHSNAFLIKIASCLSRKYELPIIAQSNIGDHISNSVYTIRESRRPGQYLDTYEVAFQIYELCKEHGFKEVLVLAHPDHAWRCKKTLEKLGLNTCVIDTSACPYDSLSTQEWTRNRLLFIPREIFARVLYLLQGKI